VANLALASLHFAEPLLIVLVVLFAAMTTLVIRRTEC
jgi:hypothetical protein